jgi:hypothetical protein
MSELDNLQIPYIPTDIQNIIYKYVHNLKMRDILEEMSNKILKKQLSFEYNENNIIKILGKLRNYNNKYKIYIDYVELEQNIYSKVLILCLEELKDAREIEKFFVENELEHLGVANYYFDYYESDDYDNYRNLIKGFFLYDHTIVI